VRMEKKNRLIYNNFRGEGESRGKCLLRQRGKTRDEGPEIDSCENLYYLSWEMGETTRLRWVY